MHIYPELLSPPKDSNSKDSNFTSPAKRINGIYEGRLNSKFIHVATGYDTLILKVIFIFF